MTVAVFDYSQFITRYPEFAQVNPMMAAEYFDDATGILDNTDASPVSDAVRRLRLLNMLVAHYAALSAVGLAGPISSASEGSVTVSAQIKIPAGAEWYWTTAYGRAFWQATAFLRSMVYVACPTRRAIRWP